MAKYKAVIRLTRMQCERTLAFMGEHSHNPSDDLEHQPDCGICQTADRIFAALHELIHKDKRFKKNRKPGIP